MQSRALQLTIAAVVAESIAIIFLTWLIGPKFWTVLLLLMGTAMLSVFGFVYLLVQTPGLVKTTFKQVRTVKSNFAKADREVGENAAKVLSGLLLTFPGLVSGALGLALFAPPVRKLVRPLLVGKILSVVSTKIPTSLSDVVDRRRNVIDVDGVSVPNPGGDNRSSNPASGALLNPRNNTTKK